MQNKQIIITHPVKLFILIYFREADCQIFYDFNIISKTKE